MAVEQLDALVVGAGFGGIHQCYLLKKKGLNVKIIDMAGGVGGTWYRNRYTGSISDTESHSYQFSWDQEKQQTFPSEQRHQRQRDILAYLNHMVDKHGLRSLIRLDTQMLSAYWNQSLHSWNVRTTNGSFSARYLITSIGAVSQQRFPAILGINTFKGDLLYTTPWQSNHDFRGKTVGIIGSCCSGPEVVTAIAPVAKRLVIFQRDIQCSFPSTDERVRTDERTDLIDSHDRIWERGATETIINTRESTMPQPNSSYARRRHLGDAYHKLLRYNNLDIVDVNATPISQIVDDGLFISNGNRFQLDALIFATSCDASDNSYTRINIVGCEGQTLQQHWNASATSYLGVALSGFPNMLMVQGPQGPFASNSLVIDMEVDFITAAIVDAEHRNREGKEALLNVSVDAEREWGNTCEKVVQRSLFKKPVSWVFETSVSEERSATKFFFGGLVLYREILRTVKEEGFKQFHSS